MTRSIVMTLRMLTGNTVLNRAFSSLLLVLLLTTTRVAAQNPDSAQSKRAAIVEKAESYRARQKYQEAAWEYLKIPEEETANAVLDTLEQIMRSEPDSIDVRERMTVSEISFLSFRNNVVGVFKVENSDSLGPVNREVATYRLDRLLGFNFTPLTIMRTVRFPDGTIKKGSLMYRMSNGGSALAANAQKTDKLRFFDVIIGNSDRHDNNWGIRNTGEIVAGDHNRTFRFDNTDPANTYWHKEIELIKNPSNLGAVYARYINSQVSEFEKAIKEWVSPDRFALFLTTREKIIKRIDARIRGTYAQDSNILHPIGEIEHKLQYEPFEIVRFRDSRFEGDFSKMLTVKWADATFMRVKWKRSAYGGRGENNEPRYEIAAYRLQKLFLDPGNYVVPPTVGRALPMERVSQIEGNVDPTFKNCNSLLVVLQYWLEHVTHEKIYDKKRFKADTTYAMHLGNMNILSYLIKHKDSNVGNFLISTDPKNPRVFAVDNSLAFSSSASNRGTAWRTIRVKRLPKKTIERLKLITKKDLEHALGVVAQFEVQDRQLVSVDFTENLSKFKS